MFLLGHRCNLCIRYVRCIRCMRHSLYSFFLVGTSVLFHSTGMAQSPNLQVPNLKEITVTGSQSVFPTPVISVPLQQIRQDGANNLGESLNTELGMSSSSFGNHSNRPIIRGMSGNRVPILQNSMAMGDLSTLSEDHAVSVEPIFEQKIQVLRGSDALRFGAGSNAGVISIENSRINEDFISSPRVEWQSQYQLQNQGVVAGLLTEGSVGRWSMHFDTTKRASNDYVRPDGAIQANSSQRLFDIGFGATYHADTSYSGISYGEYRNYYGIPSLEGAFIDMQHKRLDLVHVARNPWAGIQQLDFKYAYTDYTHQELDTGGVARVGFSNQQNQLRVEAFYDLLANWNGSVGLQVSSGKLSALELGSPSLVAAVIPPTATNKLALFAVQNMSHGALDYRTGMRLERVSLNPNGAIAYADSPIFSLAAMLNAPNKIAYQANLFSTSGSVFWNYAKGYSTGFTLQMIQRAPAVDELYSYGNHEATASFDIGNANLSKESAYQLEWGWKKTTGLIQSQMMLFQNKTMNYIYGQFSDVATNADSVRVRQYAQADANLIGFESDLQYNPQGAGFSGRLFTDQTRGTFADSSSIPLQPAIRMGGHVGYALGPWSSKLSLIHALGQSRLAKTETTPTASYNKLDFKIMRQVKLGTLDSSIYFLANNLLNDTIRYSTTVDTVRMNAPAAGRNFLLGLSVRY